MVEPRTGTDIAELVKTVSNDIRTEWTRLSTLQKKLDGKLTRTWMPDNSDLEYKDLFRKASGPWLTFVRDVIAQGCRVNGYSNEQVWDDVWQANGMDGRQGAVNRQAIGLGKSFLLLQPADTGVAMRPLSSLATYAVYSDPFSEYPDWCLTRTGKQKASFWDSDWAFVDEHAVYRFRGDPRAAVELDVTVHGLGYTPVVRISNTLPIDGEPASSIEPGIPIYQRIVDATFTLQMVQRYGAFPQKWMAGGEIATNPDGTPAVRSSVDGLLHASGETGESARFGTFASADLNQVVAAVDAHIKHLAAVCQVPPHYLLGSVANLSADAIAATESGYSRNIADRRDAIGEGYELALRTGAAILGDDAAADDTSSQVHWEDVSTRSIGAISDAVLKLATVGAPLELLFAMVPGWSKADVLDAARGVDARLAQAAELKQLTSSTPPPA